MHPSYSAGNRKRIFLYGCGITAPGADNLKTFVENIWQQKRVLTPESAFNDMFLVGKPLFDFQKYKEWISKRFNPSRFNQLCDKGLDNVRMALGTTIDALEQNPGLEEALKHIHQRTLIVYGSGFGDLNSQFKATKDLEYATIKWNNFWATPTRNAEVKKYIENPSIQCNNVPTNPMTLPDNSFERFNAMQVWDAYWAPKSEQLKEYLNALIEIEFMHVGDDIANDKLNLIRSKAKAKKLLKDKYNHPTPPWESVSANLLWNIPNATSAQVSMLLGIHGPAYGTIGACATFGVVVRQALDAIRSGNFDAAIIGTTDVPPPAEVVAGFYDAKVLAGGPKVGIPLTEMRGTHVSGGACTWIIATEDVMDKLNINHLGIEILGAGVSSDAEHIITPSLEGPKAGIRDAFLNAQITSEEVDTWDMHATGTPGDATEITLIEEFINPKTVLTARKGLFGHAMASCGALEITAQIFGAKKEGKSFNIPPSGIPTKDMHAIFKDSDRKIATDKPMSVNPITDGLVCGKLNMGVGGLTSCIFTKVY